MAPPSAPTIDTIASEALQRAGYVTTTTQYTTALARAKNEWAEQIKNDIFTIEKKLASLMTLGTVITIPGVNRYSFPTDYQSLVSMELMDGAVTGIAQGGAVGSITFASDDESTANGIIGKEVLIYDGTAKGQLSQITAYDETTKIASVYPNFTVAPVANDLYMIVDTYYDLNAMVVSDFDKTGNQTSPGTPNSYSPIGDSSVGSFLLFPTPYRSSGVIWGVKIRYFANLMNLDLAGALIGTLYQRWRNLFTQGLYWKALQSLDDVRTKAEGQSYISMLQLVLSMERYGAEVDADIQFSVQRRN